MAATLVTPRRSTTRRFHALPNTWNEERVAVALQEWTQEVGAPPKSYEWCPATARSAGVIGPEETKWEREHPRWPGNTTVYHYFDSWLAALEAAGIEPEGRPKPEGTLAERVEAAQRMRAAGESVRSIADALGVRPVTVYGYLKAQPCRSCGGPVVCAGKKLCHRCGTRQGNPRRWSDEEVLSAVRKWTRLEGRPPTQIDWRPVRFGGAERWEAELARALLFDLDETLMVEEPAAVAAFAATAQVAAVRYDIDPELLAAGARSRARELWYAAPTHPYCMRVGISSWEGLWCRFEGDGADVRALREWSPAYRQETWTLALADQGVDDPRLAGELAERYGEERRARHEVFTDAVGALTRLGESHSMALITNGAGCLQREKLAASGLADFFDAVVVSADLGLAKPDASIFEHVLTQLDVDGADAVMIGDSISKDVDGALAAGLGAIWVNRNGAATPDRADLVEISTLSDLPNALEE